MPPEERTDRITVRVAPSEMKMLRDLAEQTGLSAADIVRLGIRRQHAERCDPLPELPRQPRKPRRP
jgi:uncharacterized protein (DUF1778 family)